LHINSGGGDVFDAVAIYSGLRNHKATVNVAVDGIAASAASFIAMAGDTVGIEKPARMMIHDASGLVIGNASDMRDMAELLDDVSDTIAEIYADRAGESTDTWRGRMKSETWYSAQQAVDAKLADSIIGNKPAEATNRERISQQIRARARARMRGSAA
jgi:ATP-dependent protease ClpP protease subunit